MYILFIMHCTLHNDEEEKAKYLNVHHVFIHHLSISKDIAGATQIFCAGSNDLRVSYFNILSHLTFLTMSNIYNN